MRWILSVISLCKCKFDIMSQYVYALFFGNAVDKTTEVAFCKDTLVPQKEISNFFGFYSGYVPNKPTGGHRSSMYQVTMTLTLRFLGCWFLFGLVKGLPVNGLTTYLSFTFPPVKVSLEKMVVLNRHSHWNSTWTSRTVTDCCSFFGGPCWKCWRVHIVHRYGMM